MEGALIKCAISGVGNLISGEVRKVVQHQFTHTHQDIEDANTVSIIERLEKGSDYDMLRTGMIKILYELNEIKFNLGITEDGKKTLSDTAIGPIDYLKKETIKAITCRRNAVEQENMENRNIEPEEKSDSDIIEPRKVELSNNVIDPMEGRGIKSKSSKWIDHVKAHSKTHNISYKQALKAAKESYKK
jgi:hypothetical protein